MVPASDLPLRLSPELESASDELSSWDFLQDLDAGFNLRVEDMHLPQPAMLGSAKHERLKEQNRVAQKRARDKRRASCL